MIWVGEGFDGAWMEAVCRRQKACRQPRPPLLGPMRRRPSRDPMHRPCARWASHSEWKPGEKTQSYPPPSRERHRGGGSCLPLQPKEKRGLARETCKQRRWNRRACRGRVCLTEAGVRKSRPPVREERGAPRKAVKTHTCLMVKYTEQMREGVRTNTTLGLTYSGIGSWSRPGYWRFRASHLGSCRV